MRNWWLIRDMCLFFGGLAGVAYETIFTSIDRPELLVVYAAMMGLPTFLQADHRISKHDGEEKESEKERP